MAGELAFEIGEQPYAVGDLKLQASVNLRKVTWSRGALWRESRCGRRGQTYVDVAIGIELVHPGDTRKRRQSLTVRQSHPRIDLNSKRTLHRSD